MMVMMMMMMMIHFNTVLHYLFAGTKAIRPNRQTALQHKINANIQETNENSGKSGDKNHS